jgi:hypothetical protein
MNKEIPRSMRFRASRFFSDRHAYRTKPNNLSEWIAFGMVVFTAVWPIVSLAHALAATPR